MTDKKFDDHRERIIACLAVEDQVLDHMIFGTLFRAELDNFSCTANKVGWVPLPAGYRQLFGSFERPVAIDKSAWDWTLPGWCVYAFFEMHYENAPDLVRRIVWNRLQEVLGEGCVYRFPDGTRLRQNFKGLMKSGWFMTISMNSTCQVLQHALASIRAGIEPTKLWAIGDDMLIEEPADLELYLAELKKTGCIVKHAKKEMEFAGMTYLGPHSAQPIYGPKHQFRLAYMPMKDLPTAATSLSLWYSLAPDKTPIRPYLPYALFTERTTTLWAFGLAKLDFGW